MDVPGGGVTVEFLEESFSVSGFLLTGAADFVVVEADNACLEDKDDFSEMGQSSLGFFLFSPEPFFDFLLLFSFKVSFTEASAGFSPLLEETFFDFLLPVSFKSSSAEDSAVLVSFSYTAVITL